MTVEARGHAGETAASQIAAINVTDLTVTTPDGDAIISEVNLAVRPGQILGIVGESGSGKTTLATALLGFTTRGASIASGVVEIAGSPITGLSERQARSLRGRLVSYVPQNPGTSLNPATRVGRAIEQILVAHLPDRPSDRVTTALQDVGLPGTKVFADRFPHELSGGQQQRVCIAASTAGEPPVVVLDEPTTGLDTVSQATILEKLAALRAEHDIAMVYVTHDLAVVGQIADRIAVMYGGRIIEVGPARDVLTRPRHPYTRGLLAAIPDHRQPGVLEPIPGVVAGLKQRTTPCVFAPRCALHEDTCDAGVPPLLEITSHHEAACFRSSSVTSVERTPVNADSPSAQGAAVLEVRNLRAEHRGRGQRVVAASDVSFTIQRGECVALVGESGSGKTTIARTLAGLHQIAGGELLLNGSSLAGRASRRTREQRQLVQMIFQNPAEALNPRQTVGEALTRPATLLRGFGRADAKTEALRLLNLVRLPSRTLTRLPGELSGGEQQRIGIARALAADPALIICDEITSALDVSVQAAVLGFLDTLRQESGVSLLMITHDLGVVASTAQQVVVLERGLICEQGPTHSLLTNPTSAYTQRLLEVAPSLSTLTAS